MLGLMILLLSETSHLLGAHQDVTIRSEDINKNLFSPTCFFFFLLFVGASKIEKQIKLILNVASPSPSSFVPRCSLIDVRSYLINAITVFREASENINQQSSSGGFCWERSAASVAVLMAEQKMGSIGELISPSFAGNGYCGECRFSLLKHLILITNSRQVENLQP